MDDLIEWFGETERQIAEAEPIVSDAEKLRELSRDHKVIFFTYLTASFLVSPTLSDKSSTKLTCDC